MSSNEHGAPELESTSERCTSMDLISVFIVQKLSGADRCPFDSGSYRDA